MRVSADTRPNWFVRNVYCFGGAGTSAVGHFAFSIPWWQSLLVALPTLIAGFIDRDFGGE